MPPRFAVRPLDGASCVTGGDAEGLRFSEDELLDSGLVGGRCAESLGRFGQGS